MQTDATIALRLPRFDGRIQLWVMLALYSDKIVALTTCRWSDHFAITVTRALAPEVDGVPLGPFQVTDEEMQKILEQGHKLELLSRNHSASKVVVGTSSSIHAHRKPSH